MSLATDILNRAIQIGTEKSNLANQAAQTAQSAAQGYITLTAPTIPLPPKVVEPSVLIPESATGVDSALFDLTYNRIIGDLSEKFADFFNDYFPNNSDLMEGAHSWLSRAINQGGSGINAIVEGQLWQRDRDRIVRTSSSAEDEAIAGWAGRGFPMPPGAAAASLAQIRRDRDAKIMEQSRDRAIKTFEQEIENVKFALTATIDYRLRSIAAASDYIRLLALAPQVASGLATSSASAQANLISAATGYYGARIKVAELTHSAEHRNAELNMRTLEKSADGFNSRLSVQANVAASIAQSLGAQASAALNAVNGTAQIIEQVQS